MQESASLTSPPFPPPQAEESGETGNCQPEFMYKAWVDYSFMIGAWCFTLGNYAVYFQVINFEGGERKTRGVHSALKCRRPLERAGSYTLLLPSDINSRLPSTSLEGRKPWP